jgi:hypothetical protein
MNDSNIREWTVDSHPEADFFRFAREHVPGNGPARVVTDFVQAADDGVSTQDSEDDPIRAPADVVLAAVFRQAGIVGDLRALLDAAKREGGGANYAAAKRVEAAFGEALS